ncbi:hypothetical protein Pcinc_002149 [Petrolisthes cinctipes]|uniref:HAT C-terminal dimerisation domain-containing protein n=1 Tax=Petrolisthes cinctipes TaxID=88211 RepID=A0AAE1GLI1_PETCI|nr:hypothetical protein Pcinc_002149 [Petrolisthes cinctipes]
MYGDEQLMSRETDPLEWWRIREECLQSSAKLARKYLGIVATSVPSERLLLKAGQLSSDRRASLKPKNVNIAYSKCVRSLDRCNSTAIDKSQKYSYRPALPYTHSNSATPSTTISSYPTYPAMSSFPYLTYTHPHSSTHVITFTSILTYPHLARIPIT